MCSSTRGPAIWPSLVTWPISSRALPRCLAKRISAWAAARSWVTVPGACSSPSTHMVWIESTISRSGACGRSTVASMSPAEVALASCTGGVSEAEPKGAQPDLVDRFLAADIDDRAALDGQGGCRLQHQRALADAGVAADQDRRPGDDAAAQHPVELVDAAGQARRRGRWRLRAARARAAGRCALPPAAGAGLAAASSTRLFQAPQSSQRPAQRGWAAPQLWQTKARCGLAIRPAIAAAPIRIGPSARPWMNWSTIRVAAVVDAFDRALPDDPAVVEHGHPVGDLAHARHVVGDRQCGGAQLATQRTISSLITSAMIGSRPVVGSSKNRISGCVGDGAGEADALLHPAGQLGRHQPRRPRAPGPTMARVSLGLGHAPPRASTRLVGEQAEGDVLPDRQAVEQRPALEQHAELAAQLVHGGAVGAHHLDAVDADRAAVRASSGRART